MRFAVEQWSPEYGSPGAGDDEVLDESSTTVDPSPERPTDTWAPLPTAAATRFDDVLFVDGVRRVDANAWIADDDGGSSPALCATYAAGAVRCRGQEATLEDARVERGLFATAPEAEAITTRHGRYDLHLTTDRGPTALALALQRRMSVLEGAVAAGAGPADVVVVDGPLRAGRDADGVVGFVKTHHVAYGPAVVRQTVTRLGPGERTPVMLLSARGDRFSWYLRLPCEPVHGWAGVVRLETGTSTSVPEVVALADRLGPTLARLASAPVKDGRAPQNLYPIGGLERELRRRLGDPVVLLRALREAAGRPVPST